MSNSIYNDMNKNSDIVSKFNEFKRNYTGNPKEEVQRLLNSGRMTQGQFNQLQNMAKMYSSILK